MKEIKAWQLARAAHRIVEEFGKWFLLEHFLNPYTNESEKYAQFGQPNWVEILAVTEDGQVLVIRQFKQGCRYVNSEIAAGTLKGIETPMAAAARYLLAETGYEASELVPLFTNESVEYGIEPATRRWFWMTTRNSTTHFYGFVAKGCRKVNEPHENPNDPMECLKMPLREFIDFMQNRSENSAQTAVTFAALPHLGITLNFPA